MFSAALCVLEYYLEDAIKLTHFIAPPRDKKKKNPFAEDDGDEVTIKSSPFTLNTVLLLLCCRRT